MTKRKTEIKPQELKRISLTEQIAESIEEMIGARQLQVGDRLPSEIELGKLFNVNRMTVAKALHILEQRDLIERTVGRGTFIKQMSDTMMADYIARFCNHSKCSFGDLLQYREYIEPELAAQAAIRHNREEIEELSRLLQEMKTSLEKNNLKALAIADANFHKELAAISGNQLIMAIANGLHTAMVSWVESMSIKDMKLQANEELAKESMDTHEKILKAIGNKDPDAARDLMRRHIVSARASHLEYAPDRDSQARISDSFCST